MFILDPKIDVSEAKTIRLAGADYLIPTLMLRQTKKIAPLLPQILTIVNRRAKAFELLKKADGNDAALSEEERLDVLSSVTLTEDEADVAIKAVAFGLSRAYPAVTPDALCDMPIEISELMVALTTIISQTHATKEAKPGDAATAVESAAASP